MLSSAPPVSTLQATAAAYRAALLRQDKAAALALLRAYRPVQERLLTRLKTLTDQIAERRKTGQPVSRAWLQRQDRYRDLLTDVAREIHAYSRVVEGQVTNGQAAAMELGRVASMEQIEASLGTRPPGASVVLNRLPYTAVQEVVGTLQDGSPLSALLDSFGTDASTAVREALLTGVAQGLSPRVTAVAVRKALGGSAVRALLISRTETLRAYRASSQEAYKANQNVVKGWRWLSAQSVRTCAMCWAMSGTEHALDEDFASHVSCRCTQVPITKTWAELGFTGIPDTQPTMLSGAEAFARRSQADQRQILGPSKYALYQDDKLALRDLVTETRSKQWGKGRRERTLREILDNPPAPPKPTLIPVGDVLQFPRSGAAVALRPMVDAINQVHGTTDLPTISVKTSTAKNYVGSYGHTPGGKAVDIGVTTNAPQRELTFVHEVGHFIDHQGINTADAPAGKFASGSDRTGVMQAWHESVRQSSEYRRLEGLRKQKVFQLQGGSTHPVNQKYLKYLLGDDELWARSYAQYITVRSGNAELMQQLTESLAGRMQTFYPIQWSAAEFEPIAQAMDDIFRKLGWLR